MYTPVVLLVQSYHLEGIKTVRLRSYLLVFSLVVASFVKQSLTLNSVLTLNGVFCKDDMRSSS